MALNISLLGSITGNWTAAFHKSEFSLLEIRELINVIRWVWEMGMINNAQFKNT